MAVAGVMVGLGGAFAARAFLARFLYGVSSSDPLTMSGAAILLILVVAAASAIPARRAMRIDPVQSRRGE